MGTQPIRISMSKPLSPSQSDVKERVLSIKASKPKTASFWTRTDIENWDSSKSKSPKDVILTEQHNISKSELESSNKKIKKYLNDQNLRKRRTNFWYHPKNKGTKRQKVIIIV